MIETRLWFDDSDTCVDIELAYVPRIGETVNWSPETGHTIVRTVIDVDWYIGADGKQSAVVTLADPEAVRK